MKKNRIFSMTAALLCAAMLCACGGNGGTDAPETADTAENIETTTETTTEAIPDDGSVYADFGGGSSPLFEASNGWSNGDMFNVTWRDKNCTFENGKMQLIIDNDTELVKTVPYSGGEYRSKEHYGYGLYEVSMKAIKNDGVVSSFFTYTGPSEGNPWDEIDVEILGKDTTKVQFNYFTDSKGNHEFMYDLGFDASEGFHTYGFDWQADKITWYVDGQEAHSVSENIPVTESKIMMNAWCGTGVDGWLNAFDDSQMPLRAEYEWVKFTPAS
ncbi:MAG: glycoside hydrolase family 16 protein [Oscillospiraceae bacterium]|nr:glycoside hydrolase family 16 protein [Oscillospiraceae bacterium]